MTTEAKTTPETPHWNVIPLRRGQAGGRANAQARFDERVYEGLEPNPYPEDQTERVAPASVRRHPQVERMREAFYAALDAGATPEDARAAALAVQG